MSIQSKTLTTIALLTVSGIAQAELTGNLGFESEYVFRGIPQADSSAQGGLDFEKSGFYVGTWAADVDQGAEIDLYGGYNWSVTEDFTVTAGVTGYYYTDSFDDTYQEVNLKAAYKWLGFELTKGEYENFDMPTQDYTFGAVSAEWNGLSGTVGTFGDDFDGEYYQVGYGTEVSGLDVGISWVYSTDDLLGGSADNTIVFSVKKTLGIVD